MRPADPDFDFLLFFDRGFAGYWSVEGTAETAMGGKWVKGPGMELFKALKTKLGNVPIMAEDLGVITTDVNVLREVRKRKLYFQYRLVFRTSIQQMQDFVCLRSP